MPNVFLSVRSSKTIDRLEISFLNNKYPTNFYTFHCFWSRPEHKVYKKLFTNFNTFTIKWDTNYYLQQNIYILIKLRFYDKWRTLSVITIFRQNHTPYTEKW